MFLTYKADYIHIFLKPLATTHLLGIKATTVTLNFYTEFNLKQKISGNMIHYATDNEREKQKVISTQIAELLAWKTNAYITFQALTAPVHDCWWPSVLAVRLYSSQCTCQQITIMLGT